MSKNYFKFQNPTISYVYKIFKKKKKKPSTNFSKISLQNVYSRVSKNEIPYIFCSVKSIICNFSKVLQTIIFIDLITVLSPFPFDVSCLNSHSV